MYSEQFAYVVDIPPAQGDETFSRFEQLMLNQLIFGLFDLFSNSSLLLSLLN